VKLARFRKPKAACLLLYVEHRPDTQEYHEKQVTLRGGHIQKGEDKRRKLRRGICLMYSLYKNEYKISRLAETTKEGD
jgi:hypothetical protein